jgi:sporulation protein YlmC with PRC-barrel domain
MVKGAGAVDHLSGGGQMAIADPHAKGNYILSVKTTLIGSKVLNPAGEALGKIEDIIVDFRNDQVAYAILSFGGTFGWRDKHFAIPWSVIQYNATDQCAVIDIDQERLASAPGFEKENWPDMADNTWADEIQRHYGVSDKGCND